MSLRDGAIVVGFPGGSDGKESVCTGGSDGKESVCTVGDLKC